MQQFIERKREFKESREDFTLHIDRKLIAIDGIDGSGKDLISQKLLEMMRKKHGDNNVVLIDVTHSLDDQGGKTRLGKVIDESFDQKKTVAKETEMQRVEDRIDATFIATVNRAYTEKVIPALESGKIVIIPRSELNLIRFMLQKKDEKRLSKEKECLINGTTTAGVLSGNRIFISVTASDSFQNIEDRGGRTHLDPKNITETELFVQTQSKAEEIISQLPTDKGVNIVRVQNHRVEKGRINQHIEELCGDIIKSLKLD